MVDSGASRAWLVAAAALAAACLVAAASAAPTTAHPFSSRETAALFAQWQADYGVEYASAEEAQRRARVFAAKVHRYGRAALSPYTDRTEGEFRRLFPIRTTAAAHPYPPGPDYPFKPFSAAYVKQALAEGTDWRTKGAVTPVKNQGSQGVCGTFGQTQDAESQYFLGGGGRNPAKKPNPLTSFSEQYLVSCSFHPPAFAPASHVDEAYYFFDVGLMSQADYPFNTTHWDDQDPPPCYYNKSEVIPKSLFTNRTSLAKSDGEEQLAAFVHHNGPVQIGLNAGIFSHADADHFVSPEACAKANLTHIDHSIGIVGYGDKEGWGPYWIIKNSWSAKFADHGYIYLARGVGCGCLFEAGAHVYTYGPPEYYYEA